MVCVESFLDRIDAASDAMQQANKMEELCNERMSEVEDRYFKSSAEFEKKTSIKGESVDGECDCKFIC